MVEHGVSGYLETSPDRLAGRLALLAERGGWARALGAAARRHARDRFNIERFIRDWNDALRLVTGTPVAPRASVSSAARSELLS